MKPKKLKTIINLLLIFTVASLAGCHSKDKNDSTNQLDDKEAIGYVNIFFTKYKFDGPGKALDYIFSTTETPEGLDNLKNKLDSAKVELGPFLGYEQITEKNVANGMILVSYLVKHKNHPIRFTFVFYKPENNWHLYKFLFDTDLEDELEASGKIYFIK